MNQFKSAINKSDISLVGKYLKMMIPFCNNSIFNEKFQELDIQDYILKTLKMLAKKTEEKTNKNPKEQLKSLLGSFEIPDFDFSSKK